MITTRSSLVLGVLALAGCQADRRPEPAVVSVVAPAAGVDGPGAALAGRTISVTADAEILTAPDLFEVVVAFEVQTATLDEARDESRKRAAALLGVVAKHAIPDCDVQSEQLSLQPRYDGSSYPAQRLIGYQATRSLTVTLRDVDAVEGLLFDMLAAGANRVDRVTFHSSALQEKRAEARVLAVQAARTKAEAMAAALGQSVGEPLRIEETGAANPWQAPAFGNYVHNNMTAPQIGETMATGKISVHANVAVVFRLQAG